jgi:hypothetical protein
MDTGTLWVFPACTWFGIRTLCSASLDMASWRVAKILLFGQIFLVYSLMAVFCAPIEVILQHMQASGSVPEPEFRLQSEVNRVAFAATPCNDTERLKLG